MNKKNLFDFFRTPTVFGHRGYSSLAPENTMPAFRLCAEKQIPGIELDVQICKTGELVVIHDFTLERVTGNPAKVCDTSLSTIRTLDAGSHFSEQFKGEQIPLLDEIFTEFGDLFRYDIELKAEGIRDNGLASKVWESVNRFSLQSQVMISSFNPFPVAYFRKISSGTLPTAVIYSNSPDIPAVLRHGEGRYIAHPSVLKPHRKLLNSRVFIRDHERRNYPIITWTVDSHEEAAAFAKLGVEGIISNDPERIRNVF